MRKNTNEDYIDLENGSNSINYSSSNSIEEFNVSILIIGNKTDLVHESVLEKIKNSSQNVILTVSNCYLYRLSIY